MSPAPSLSRLHLAALLAVVALAAALRVAGLAYEVRHPQHYEERVFLNNVIEMLAAGDGDHRFYEYPGLFFYLLAVPVALAQPERIDDPAAYLAARIFVAACGVASVALVHRVGTRLAGPGAGLAAGLLLAVSPHDVAISHTNRPDIPLQTAALLAYLALLGIGRDWRGDLRAGLGIGIATAIKFNGFLLFPSYLVARLQAPGPRWGRMAWVVVVAALVVLVATPYAVIRPQTYLGGVGHQMSFHYREPLTLASYLANLATYGKWIALPLGILGTTLAGFGAVLALRDRRAGWPPILAHLVVTVLVMSSADVTEPRFLLPATGAVCLAAGLGVEALGAGRVWLVALLTLGAAITPFAQSLDRVRPLMQPSPRDAALDWIEANLPSGSRILETRPDAPPDLRALTIGADPRRYELLFRPSWQGGLRLLAPNVDLVITGPRGGVRWSQGLRTVFRGEGGGRTLFELKVPKSGARPHYVPLAVTGVTVDASAGRDGLTALTDGDRDTAWSSAGPVSAGDWIDVKWIEPVAVARIELWIANRPQREPNLRILTRDAVGAWKPRDAIPAREAVLQQIAAGRRPSQVFLLDPEPITGVRVEAVAWSPDPWALAALELWSQAPAPQF